MSLLRLSSRQSAPLLVQVVEEESLKDLLDNVVNDEKLPAHDEEEELRVPVRDQHFVNGSRELLVLVLYGVGLGLALR